MNQVWIANLKIYGVEDGASVGIGPHIHVSGGAHMKANQGNGQINGDFSSIPAISAWINDPDLIDAGFWHQSGPWF